MHLSPKKDWITQIIFIFATFLFSSVGPIILAMESLYKYQLAVFHYDKYQDIPGPSELHVINIDMDMRRNGNLSMHCIGPKPPIFHLANIIDSESFSKRPYEETFPKPALSDIERKAFLAMREDDEMSGWYWIIVHPMKCEPVTDGAT
jgi:hypothetical protein